MGLFKGLFSGLAQAADDDVNGLVRVLLFCLIDDDNYKNYRTWLVGQVLGNLSVKADAAALGIFTSLTNQAANLERRGIRASLDKALWEMRQAVSLGR